VEAIDKTGTIKIAALQSQGTYFAGYFQIKPIDYVRSLTAI
jgi:hypothetical protein